MATTTKTFTSPGQGTWIAPPGVATVQAEAWGAGAGGGVAAQAEGGGGGGAYAVGSALPVAAQTNYPYFVGTAGIIGGNGGSAWFSGTTTVFAPGGLFPSAGTNPGLGGTAGIGTPTFAGGNGGSATVGTAAGGGGGGGASNSGVGGLGGNNVGTVGGAAGTAGAGAGAGGHGGNRTAAGTVGVAPGGAGGGGGTTANAAAGAAGQVKLVYTTPLISNLTDALQNNSQNTNLWAKGGNTANVALVNNDLEITIPLSTTEFNFYNSLEFYDWTSSNAFVHVKTPTTSNIVSQEAGLIFQIDTSNKLWMFFGDGLVKAFKLVASVQTQIGGNVTYDPAQHQYVRVRESGGTWFFDTSPDRLSWTNQFSQLDPFSGNKTGQAIIYCQHWQSETTTTTDKFDNFNINAGAVFGYRTLLGAGQA